MKILVFRYNISFIDPPLGGFGEIYISFSDDISLGLKLSGNIITSGNISPNPPRSGSINDNYIILENSLLHLGQTDVFMKRIQHYLRFSML